VQKDKPSSPILFVVFNRPEVTRRVFEEIRRAKPAKLFVSVDGPRKDNHQDTDRISQVVDIVQRVDWDCEAFYRFSEKNHGCRAGVSTAIEWFFENESEGIILEDDCLPHKSFFHYCSWALETYRNDKRVWHVNGNNFSAPEVTFSSELAFTALPQVWGWATWRDRWQSYMSNPYYLIERSGPASKGWSVSWQARVNKLRDIESLTEGVDTWDYQWQATVLNARGLCLSSRSNLISNLGGGEDATHTKVDNRLYLPMTDLRKPIQKIEPQLDSRLTRWYEKNMGLAGVVRATRVLARNWRKQFVLLRNEMVTRLLYLGQAPIVIASPGRSGSTMLFESVVEGLVRHRFGVGINGSIGRFLAKRASNFLSRLADVDSTSCPVLKTHDLSDELSKIDNVRAIFVYSDPLDSAKSAKNMLEREGVNWMDEHLFNLRSTGSASEILREDVLNYGEQMRSWLGEFRPNVLALPYEHLWDREDELSQFLGFEILLPTRRSRSEHECEDAWDVSVYQSLRNLQWELEKSYNECNEKL
jgi:hypothetical protein